MQKFFFFLLVIFIHHPANAQYEEKDFIRYTVKDGLSDNYITCLQQDNQGYIWAGTELGLSRFDGSSFKNYYQGSAALPLLPGAIHNLKLFRNNQLGILSRGGFQLLNTNNFSVQNYYIPDSTAFYTQLNAAWDAVQLPTQSFAVTTTSGFHVFNKSGEVIFRYDAYSLKDIGKKRIFYGRDILSINDKELAVYTDETGLAYYNAEKKIFRNINPDENEWKIFSHPVNTGDEKLVTKYQLNSHEFIFTFHKKDSIVYYCHTLKKKVTSPLPFHSFIELSWESKIEMLNDSTFAINGGSYGFYIMHLNRQTGVITCDVKKFLPSHKIISLFIDKDKRLWAATSEGLLQQKLNPSFISSYHFAPAPGDVLTGGFMCAYSYKDKLYAGRYSLNKGLVILNKSTMQLEKQIDFYGGNNGWNEILSMEMYHADTLWLGTNTGILWFDTKTNHYGKVLDEKKYPWSSGMSVILAPVNKDGYAWMCGILQGLVVRYHIASRTFTLFNSTTQPALPFDRVKSIVYDSYGDVWIGGHSLARFNTKLQAFDTLITVYGGANKFNDDILTLSADDNGSLWLHNANNGLLGYRIKEKKFEAYTMKDGLPSDVLTSFSPVIDNTLWIGSNNHLSEFDTRTKKVIVYDQQDGLPEHKPSSRKIYYDRENNLMYLFSGEYITKIPAQQYQTSDYSSGLLLQELIVNNKKSFFNTADEIQLKHNENNLLLNYTIVDFEKNNYQFAYKINNDENWNNLGPQRNLNLNNLQPAKYLIQLKAAGKSGNEKIKELTLIIQSPFWKTVWFLTVCGLFLAGMLYYLYRSRIKQVRQKADIDKLLAQTEMKALHAQMNPHFIFNSLNSIREMILCNENKEASHYLSKFAHLIRVTLDQSGESFISLRNTIDYLNRYIEMEQIRNSHFTSRILADEELDLDETVLPPMLIQPFIENAIWHGTTGTKKDININIDFKKSAGSRGENNLLVCIIDDNGIGIEQSLQQKNSGDTMHNPVGIDNIKNRIRLLNEKYKLKCNLTIEDKTKLTGCTETGTLVTLQLPLEIADHE
jgi:ligand-binding sensor domain-containing protein/two-component sensor histidine kinase